MRPRSQDRGTPELRRMSPWDRIQSCVSCCCNAALNLWITAALLYGRPSLAHRTTQKDSSNSSRKGCRVAPHRVVTARLHHPLV